MKREFDATSGTPLPPSSSSTTTTPPFVKVEDNPPPPPPPSTLEAKKKTKVEKDNNTMTATKASEKLMAETPSIPSYPPPPVMSPTADSQTIKTINERLDALWEEQKKETTNLKPGDKADFKHHNDLPLARIKRVMKSDEDVRMISAEAPILFAKACELFVLDITTRAWGYSEHNKRQQLEKDDVVQVLNETPVYDFLTHVIAPHLVNGPLSNISAVHSSAVPASVFQAVQANNNNNNNNTTTSNNSSSDKV